jgi:ADP-heptose:LPS heptosyltransferase
LKKIERKGKVVLARALAPVLRASAVVPDRIEYSRIERLLIIRQHNQMGDMLLAVPALRGIRNRFPRARITLVAASINSEVMHGNPYVDEVLTWSKKRNWREPFAFFRFIAALRRRRFDMVIVLNTVSFSVTSMLLGAVSGAGLRAGSTSAPFGNDLTAVYYDIELPLPSKDELSRMHESEHNLYPLSAIGIEESDLSSILVPSGAQEEDCENFISAAFGTGARYAVVHPGAGKVQNIWPPERFAEVVDYLQEKHSIPSVAVRGPVDGEVFSRFLGSCRSSPQVISCPDIGFAGALMRRAALCICNDTGVAHIAGAVGARCIEIFGPTDPRRWKPVSDKVTAVRGSDTAMESVSTDDVITMIDRILTAGAGSG